jgi:hypothetical protein
MAGATKLVGRGEGVNGDFELLEVGTESPQSRKGSFKLPAGTPYPIRERLEAGTLPPLSLLADIRQVQVVHIRRLPVCLGGEKPSTYNADLSPLHFSSFVCTTSPRRKWKIHRGDNVMATLR